MGSYILSHHFHWPIIYLGSYTISGFEVFYFSSIEDQIIQKTQVLSFYLCGRYHMLLLFLPRRELEVDQAKSTYSHLLFSLVGGQLYSSDLWVFLEKYSPIFYNIYNSERDSPVFTNFFNEVKYSPRFYNIL